MNTSFEELVGSYVSRTENPGSSYHAELVQSICASLRKLGYQPSSDIKKLRMTIRRLLAEEQKRTLSAAKAKAKKVSAEYADDLVQEAWLEHLEAGVPRRPAGSTERWTSYVHQQSKPFTIPRSLLAEEERHRPTIVEPLNADDDVMLEAALYSSNSTPESELRIKEAVRSLSPDMQEDVLAFFVDEEPVVEFSRRKGLSLQQAQDRKDEVLKALRQGFDGA